jgi:hypothetical protein
LGGGACPEIVPDAGEGFLPTGGKTSSSTMGAGELWPVIPSQKISIGAFYRINRALGRMA